jgi:hypothetical protein
MRVSTAEGAYMQGDPTQRRDCNGVSRPRRARVARRSSTPSSGFCRWVTERALRILWASGVSSRCQRSGVGRGAGLACEPGRH